MSNSLPIALRGISARKALHIVATRFLNETEVLVGFSDGTAAVYEAEELEKLRPTKKQTLAEWPESELDPATDAPAA